MLKTQQIYLMILLMTTGLIYNNCGKVQFQTNNPDVSLLGADPVSPTSNPPVTPPTGVLTFNSSNQPATIAYNDNYPGAGDSDYNDFVVNITVTEVYDNLGGLHEIDIVYTPKYKISAADHKFVLGFDGKIRGRGGFVSNVAKFTSLAMFDGHADIEYVLSDAKTKVVASESAHDKSKDLIVFPSSTQALNDKQVATIKITNIDTSLNTYTQRGAITIKRYRTVLFNGSYDIEISDINPAFVDQGGAPVGFFVPVDWHPPKEGQSIFPAYPEFKSHALYVMSGAPLDQEPIATLHWFKSLADPTLVLP